MDKIKEKFYELVKQPKATLIAGLVIGLIIGLPVLGWGLWPVEWKDADASFLRDDLKKQYVCMVIDSYQVNQDANLAAARLDSMGVDIHKTQGIFKNLDEGGCSYTPSDPVVLNLKSAFLEMGTTTGESTTPETVAQATEIPLSQETEKEEKSGGGSVLLLLLLALFLVIGGALIYIFFIRNKRNQDAVPTPVDEEGEYIEEEEYLEQEEVIEESPEYPAVITPPPLTETIPAPTAIATEGEPVAHFMTTYVIGDDLYDDSFSIDAPNGAFLGECGVGISDTIGVGDPKKVTAFEVWLFDKNDIQTVTKVLMSSYAMNDSAIKQRLASKGEPVLLEQGQQILLETATLQLEAKVIEMVYGQGALPSGSFFERLTLELSVWPK